MATGTIPVYEPQNVTVLYFNANGVDINNATLTLGDSLEKYKFIVLLLYAGAIEASKRGLLMLPTVNLNLASYWPLACGGTLGYIRLDTSGGTTLKLLTASYSTLKLVRVYGIR